MPEAGAGLMGSVKRLTATLTSIVSTRLELLANELQEERLRLTQMLLFALFALFCFGMCLLLLTVFIVVLFWDDHRLAVLGALSVIFFASGLLAAVLLRGKSQEKSRLFSASLAELEKDREQLGVSHE
ncbi:MAG: phage holin family protein [Gallionella sp.]|nr:phage holin family protein [Gallionella sp.]